jgi:hypothetical protein
MGEGREQTEFSAPSLIRISDFDGRFHRRESVFLLLAFGIREAENFDLRIAFPEGC